MQPFVCKTEHPKQYQTKSVDQKCGQNQKCEPTKGVAALSHRLSFARLPALDVEVCSNMVEAKQ